MSGPASFRLSRETRDLLKQHQDFFSSVLSLFDGKGGDPQKTPLKFKPSDTEARTEAEVKDNGDVEVTFIIPLDDNEVGTDGRIYLKDKFVFDPTQKVLKGYRRSFEHNGQGDAGAWKGWLGKYENLVKNGPKLNDARVQSFGLSVARTFGQAVVDEQEKTLARLSTAFKREHRYLDSADLLIQEQSKRFQVEGLRLKIKDKDNFFQTIRNGEETDVIFKWTVDGDGDPANGRIWLKDRFTFKDGKMSDFSRDWAVDPKAAANPKLNNLVDSLKRQPNPEVGETKAFAENIYPDLVPQANPDPKDLTPLLAASIQGPAGESVFKSRKASGAEFDPAQKQVLELINSLAQEDIAKRDDHAQGLLSFQGKVDVNSERQNLESLFGKLRKAQAEAPGSTLQSLLEKLELSEAENGQRQKILGLSGFGELNSLAQERDDEIRETGLLRLARTRYFGEQGYPGTAAAIAESLKASKHVGAKAGQLLDLAQGKGSFGNKVEMTLGHFNSEVTKPSMLVGMMAAPFAGAAFEAGGLRLAKVLLDAKKIQSIGTGVKLGASGLGMFGESLAFTAMHRGYERLWHSSNTAWNGAGSEILSSMLLFTGMRAAHAGSGWASSRMAEGKFNFSVKGREIRFGGREGTATIGPNLAQTTPTGRMLMGNPWVTEAGVGAPTLSKLGQFTSGTMNHLGSISAMHASGSVSRLVHLAPDNGQGFGANFFDATVMYGQAMVGFNLANRATMGRLQPALGEVKMRIEGFDPKATYSPLVPEKTAGQSGSKFEFGPWLQKLLPNRSSKPAAAPKAPVDAKGFSLRVREGLGSAGEWLSNLMPSKVKALETKLGEVEKQKSAAEGEVSSKAQEIANLQSRIDDLTREVSAAKDEAAGHKSVAEGKGVEIGKLETELQGKKEELETKTQELQTAQGELEQTKAAKEAAEDTLQKIEENAEAADLGIGFSDPQAEIGALRQKIQILSSEKGAAEVRVAALTGDATELRGKIESATQELTRLKAVDANLARSEKQVADLQQAKGELDQAIEGLRRDVESKNNENDSASKLLGTMGQRISELEGLLERRDGALEEGAREIVNLREKLKTTTEEAQMLADKLGEATSEQSTLNHRLENEKSRIKVLEQTKTALERDKAELQGQVEAQGSEASVTGERLAELQRSLNETERELKDVKHSLRSAETLKTAKDGEIERMKGYLEEAQNRRNENEAKLNTSIRDLDSQVRSQAKEIEAALETAEGLRQQLSGETSRANAAEGREAELQAAHTELEAQHAQTLKDLENAGRLMRIAESKAEGKTKEIERIETDRKDLRERLDALRKRKEAVDGELTQAKAEQSRLQTRLSETERALAEERDRPPEYDATAQVELQEATENYALEKSALDTKIQGLETSQAELQKKVKDLEGEKADVERKLRSTQTEAELAKGAAQDLNQDLQDLQQRSQKEAKELRDSVESWRGRATKSETEKGQADVRITSLEGDLSRTKERLGLVERELTEKAESLVAERKKVKELSDKVQQLGDQKQELEGQILEIETASSVAKTEAEDQIATLSREKTSLESQVRERQQTVETLRKEIEEKQGSLTEAERKVREAKDEGRRDLSKLGEDKRKVDRELETKSRALTKAEGDITTLQSQVAELEGRIVQASEAAKLEQQRLTEEKAQLEGRLEVKEQGLSDAKSQLGQSQARALEFEKLLGEANRLLESKETEIAQLRHEHETITATNNVTVERLRSEAKAAEQAKESAETKAREAKAKVSQLETEISVAKEKSASENLEAATRLEGTEQRATRAEQKAAEALAGLEALRATTSAEIESLRNEALEAARVQSVAEARAKELEAKTKLSDQKITTIEADLSAARALAASLEAPASQRAQAEATVGEMRGLLEVEQGKLRAAEERATAAEERATAAEERAIAAEADAEAQKIKADQAEEKRKAAETEKNATELESRRVRAAADQASGVSKGVLTQRDTRISALEADLRAAEAENIAKDKAANEYDVAMKSKIEGLEEKSRKAEASAKAAEGRAKEADARAEQADTAVKELEAQIVQIAHARSEALEAKAHAEHRIAELLQEKSGYEHQIVQLTASISALETQALEHIAKRRELAGKAETAEQRVGQLETEIQKKQDEIDRLSGEVTKVWNTGQTVGQESKAKNQEIEDLKLAVENLRDELRQAKDEKRTIELLAENEERLNRDIQRLSGERNEAQRKAAELQRQIAQGEGGNPEVILAATNLRSAGGVSDGFFHQVDPRLHQTHTWAQGSALLRHSSGKSVGEAKIITGSAEGDMELKFADGSNVSSRTTRAGREYQEDGAYMARFVLPDGREVKVLAGADGAGGHMSGDLASGAFLQGVHARVAEAAHEGKIPTAGDLFQQGELALGKQKETIEITDEMRRQGKNPNPTGAGAVIVIVGDEATVASKGDSNLVWARPNANGEFDILGITETDSMMDPRNPGSRKYNNLTRGLGMATEDGHHNYGLRNIQAGDRFLLGSDGFYGMAVGPDLAEATSTTLRMFPGRNYPEASQKTFETIRWGLQASAGKSDRGQAWHDLALAQMRQPNGPKTFYGQQREINIRDAKDNVFVIDLEQGQVKPNAQSIIPEGHVDLWKVLSQAEIAQKQAQAGRPTPETPSPVPPPPSPRNKAAVETKFLQKYLMSLGTVYGTVTEIDAVRLSPSGLEASKLFVDLFLRYPELEEQINPDLLRGADRGGQIKIFDGAKRFLDDVKKVDSARAIAAQGILQSLGGMNKVFSKATAGEVTQLQTNYGANLHRVFGDQANKAAQLFANLHKAVPESVTLFNPDTLASPLLFNQAYFHREISQKIQESGKPYQAPTPQEVAAIRKVHDKDLEKIFGEGAPQAAEWFASLYKADPSVREKYHPGKIQFKKFLQQLMRFYSIDSVRSTDATPGADAGPIGYAADIKNLHGSAEVQNSMRSRGWTDPQSFSTGIRSWVLEPSAEKSYIGGRRDGDIVLLDSNVSGRHFAIRYEGMWILEEVHATNGIFVNGKELKRGKKHALKPNDRLRFGTVDLTWEVNASNQGKLVDAAPQSHVQLQAGAANSVNPPPPPPAQNPVQQSPYYQAPSQGPTGDNLTFMIPKGQGVIIGKEQIPDFAISADHVMIQWVQERFIIQDKGSQYGTQLNGLDIQAEMNPRGGRPPGRQHEIKHGDTLKLGNVLFRFEVVESGFGKLVQFGGSVIPPSSQHYRPSPDYQIQPLQPGQNLPLRDLNKQQIGAIEWDPQANRFNLRNLMLQNTQIWVQHNGQYYGLPQACALADGTLFGIGPSARDAQYFLFKNNLITAVNLQSGETRKYSPANGVQAPLHMEFSAADYPAGLILGRENFRAYPNVSGQHLEFRFHQGVWWVRDMASLNGTYLDGKKISTGTPQKGDPRVQGDWNQIMPGNVLGAGDAVVRFNSEGDRFSLEELPNLSQSQHSGPISSDNPGPFRPSPTAGFRDASVDISQKAQGRIPMSLGDARGILVTKKRENPGLYYADSEQKLSGEYYLNLGADGLLQMFDKDLFRLERLDGDRYRLINIGAKSGLEIQDPKGQKRPIRVGQADDQVHSGDVVLLDNGKLQIQLSR